MDIKLTKNSENCIVDLRSNILFEHIFRLKNLLEELPKGTDVALNFENVDYFCTEFLDFIKNSSGENKISLFNLQTDIFALLSLTNYDKFVHIYLQDSDFLNKKRKLINRKFSIISKN